MTRENDYLGDKQIAELKDKLLADKERILNKLSGGDKGSYSLSKDELSDPIDEASANIQATKNYDSETENFYLKKINKKPPQARARVIGLCEECGVEINWERLWARPTARCVSIVRKRRDE